jgi:Rieske 2Fe-2S family protein
MPSFERIGRLLQARKPGHALPQALYNDEEAFEFDLKAIFARNWLPIGFEAELPKPGAYLAMTIGRWPIVALRDRAGQIRGYHNSCRHRGAQILADGKGATVRLVCPYHRWAYDLSGELAHTTRMDEDFDPAGHSLAPLRVEILAGVIYVCLSDDPPSFAEFRDEFGPMLEAQNLRFGRLACESTLVEKGNWKLVMENARECYHCAVSHPELSESFPVEAKAYFDYGDDPHAEAFNARMKAAGLAIGPVEGDWWQGIRFALNAGYRSMTMDGDFVVSKPMCQVEGGDVGSLRWALEPNSFFHAFGDYCFMFSAWPVGPNETHVIGKWLVRGDAEPGIDYDPDKVADLWTRTNLQDRDLVENNQRGVNSLGYIPGPYSSEAETLVVRFVDWYCKEALGYLAGQTARTPVAV